MSLAQEYRSQLAAKQGNRLLLYLIAAAAFHAGAIAAGLLFWQQPRGTTEQAIALQTPPPLPLDFVYLNSPSSPSAKPEQTERHAQVDAVAGGKHRPDLPVNPGKPDAKETAIAPHSAKNSSPVKAVTPVSTTVTPSLSKATASPPHPTAAPPIPSPATNPEPSQKQVQTTSPQPLTAPTASTAVPASQPLPSLQAANPVLPPASPVPQLPQASPLQAASPQPNSATPIPPPATPPQATAASQLGAPLSQQTPTQLGQGLDGQFNPNRTAAGLAGVDAKRDDLWGEYIAALNREIDQHWQRIPIQVNRQAKVKFMIDRQGELTSLQLLQSSGDQTADQAAMEAIQTAAPFNPLPSEATEDALVINFTFTYRIPPASP